MFQAFNFYSGLLDIVHGSFFFGELIVENVEPEGQFLQIEFSRFLGAIPIWTLFKLNE